VQDLREVNKSVQDIHPTAPNPYNLLSMLPPERTWYMVLDLKDAFFCLRLHPNSQAVFALNGETQRMKKKKTGNSQGQDCLRDLEIHPPCLIKLYIEILPPFRPTIPR
jgi:hypothetical protein